MDKLLMALLIIPGIIHLMPLSGLLGIERLNALYGLTFDDPNMMILMRHRAILFGLLGTLLIWSAFNPALQQIAIIGGLVSAAGFIVIAKMGGGYNGEIGRVVVADVVAVGCLLAAVIVRQFGGIGVGQGA